MYPTPEMFLTADLDYHREHIARGLGPNRAAARGTPVRRSRGIRGRLRRRVVPAG